MGTRAHTNADSAGTAPVKRSALGPPGRPAGDKHPLPALDHNQLVGNRPTTRTTFDFHPGDLTRPDRTDKRNSGPIRRRARRATTRFLEIGEKDACAHGARGTRFRDGLGMSADFW